MCALALAMNSKETLPKTSGSAMCIEIYVGIAIGDIINRYRYRQERYRVSVSASSTSYIGINDIRYRIHRHRVSVASISVIGIGIG